MSEFHPIHRDPLLFRGRELRRNSTFPERQLWSLLRSRQLCGLKFRPQFAIGPYIVDFYCHEFRLAVELDGLSHDDRREYDTERERFITSQGVRVVRFTNDDVLNDLDAVLRAIVMACGIDPDTGNRLDPLAFKPSP